MSRRTNRRLWLALGALALATWACAPGAAPPSDEEDVEEVAEEAEEEEEAEDSDAAMPTQASVEEAEESATMHFDNQSGFVVCGLFIVASESEDWGRNLLNEPLPLGEQFTVNDVPPGVYDLRMNDCDGHVVNWNIDVEVPPGAEGTAPIEPPVSYLAVVNNSVTTICGVYVALPDDPYRRNLLDEGQTIRAGIPDGPHYFNVGLEPGPRSVMVESCDGDVLESLITIEPSGQTNFDIFVF